MSEAPASGESAAPAAAPAAPPAGSNGATPPATPPAAPAASSGDWRAALPEDLRDDPHLKNYTGIEDLAKGHVNAQSTIARSIRIPGKDAGGEAVEAFYNKLLEVDGVVRVPSADASPEALGEFWNRMGRPEQAASYELKAPEFEGLEFEGGEAEKFWRGAFHELGLTQAQAQGVFERFLGESGKVMAEEVRATQEAQQALRQEWGDAYDQRYQIAMMAERQMMPDGYHELCEKMGLHKSPLHVRAMERMGRLGLEDQVIRDVVPTGQMSAGVSELRDQIAELKQNPAYNSRGHPDHNRIVEQVRARYERIETMRGAAGA